LITLVLTRYLIMRFLGKLNGVLANLRNITWCWRNNTKWLRKRFTPYWKIMILLSCLH